ncbi:TonB-dependent receptor [candidate division KSB1 bacterium]|nr:TonB-dependent receptor [candidate division KSB1 bacterium]
MKTIQILARLICFIVFIGYVSDCYAQHKPKGSLSGKVQNAQTREPLPGANIILLNTMMGTSSDLKGDFYLQNIPVGTYVVRATMMGYKSQTIEIAITADKTAVIKFELPETVLETAALVVTATKRRQALQDSPNSLTLVTSKDIERANEAYLDESLKYAPGVNFTVSNVNIRGSSGFSRGAGSRVLFMVDGIPMMPGDSGDIKWDVLPVTQVQQVEIVKGAGSALYGSFALGGIINVISKEPSLEPETNVRIASGVYDEPYWAEWQWTDRVLHFSQIDVSHSQGWNNTHVLMSAGAYSTTGYQENGHQHKWNWLGKVTQKIDSERTLILNARLNLRKGGEIILWKNQHEALTVGEESLNDETHSYKANFSVIYKGIVNKRLAYQIRSAYLENHWENHFHDNSDYSTGRNFRMEVQTDLQLTSRHVLTYGLENVYDFVNASIFRQHNAFAVGIYLQDEYKISSSLTATTGLRYDHHQIDFKSQKDELSPKLGLVLRPNLLTSIRGSVGRGFRAPTVAEMFTRTYVSGFRVEPNETLKAERSWSYEVGVNQILGENVMADVAIFQNDYWDLIEGQQDTSQTISFQNLTRARIRGAEFNIKSRWWQNRIGIDLNYTYLDPRDLDLDKPLGYRADNMVTISTSFNFGIFATNIDYRYLSRYESVKIYPDDDRVPQKVLDCKIAADWRDYKIAFDVDNLFQYHYVMVERNIAPIRRYMLTFTATY